MDLHFESNFELGAHAVYTRDQYRIEILLVHGKQAAEAANLAEHTLGEGFVGKILDALFGLAGAINVHASVGIGYWGGFRHGILGHGNRSLLQECGEVTERFSEPE